MSINIKLARNSIAACLLSVASVVAASASGGVTHHNPMHEQQPAAPVYSQNEMETTQSWDGFYFGAKIGYDLKEMLNLKINAFGASFPFEKDVTGLAASAFLGFNAELADSFVAGVDADITYTGRKTTFFILHESDSKAALRMALEKFNTAEMNRKEAVKAFEVAEKAKNTISARKEFEAAKENADSSLKKFKAAERIAKEAKEKSGETPTDTNAREAADRAQKEATDEGIRAFQASNVLKNTKVRMYENKKTMKEKAAHKAETAKENLKQAEKDPNLTLDMSSQEALKKEKNYKKLKEASAEGSDIVPIKVSNDLAGSLSVRLGFAITPQFMPYVIGGGTLNWVTVSIDPFSLKKSDYLFGWTLGAGVDIKLAENVFARGEYRHIKLNEKTFNLFDFSRFCVAYLYSRLNNKQSFCRNCI